MKSTSRLICLLSAILIISGLVYCSFKRVETFKLHEAAPSSFDGFPIVSLQLARGDSLEYEISSVGKSTGSQSAYTLNGTLNIIVLGEESNGYRVALYFSDVDLTGFDDGHAAYREALLTRLKEPVMARLAFLGLNLELDRQTLAGGMVSEFWQGTVDRTRVAVPSRMETTGFEQNESFFGESLKAHYLLENAKEHIRDGVDLKKSMDTVGEAKRVVSSRSLIHLNVRSGRMETIDFSSKESIPGLQLSSENAIRMRLRRQSRIDEPELGSIDQRAASPRDADNDPNDLIQANVLGARTFVDVWNSLEKGESQESYLFLKAWIQTHPGDLAVLHHRLKSLGNDDPKLRTSIKALTAVGSAAAQAVLIALLEAHKSDAAGHRIASSLGFLAKPGQEVENSLKGLVRSPDFPELGRRAELALGGVGGTLRKSHAKDQARAALLETLALARLAESKDTIESMTTLGMVGNLGPSDRETLKAVLKSPDPRLRAQAFFALRFALQEDTPLFLASAYHGETLASVKKQILQALTIRGPDKVWYKAIENLLSAGTVSEDDQTILAQSLARNAQDFREDSLRQLSDMQRNASSKAFQSVLGQYLERARKAATNESK